MNKPNFFIAGVAKGATTSLYFYLKQHPEIYLSEIKEPNYYTRKYIDNEIKTYGEYLELFKESRKIIGESSVSYFHYSEVVNEMKNDSPGAKIIIVLRNPVERLYSHVNMLIMRGFLERDELEDKEKLSNLFDLDPIDASFYTKRITDFFNAFGKQNVKIIFYDEIVNNLENVLKDVLVFLGVNQNFEFNIVNKFNSSGEPRVKTVNKILFNDYAFKKLVKRIIPRNILTKVAMNIQKYNIKKPYEMDEEFFDKYISLYENDINQLEELLNVDLTNWKYYKSTTV